MNPPLVTGIILNTNRREDTLTCLESLVNSDYPNLTLIVLDNGSSDDSVGAISQIFPQVSIIELAENRGYAGNNNVGIKAALDRGADWIFIINEDTVFASDAVSLLIRSVQSDNSIGVAGPLVYHHDEPGTIQSAGGMLDENWHSFHRGQNTIDEGQFHESEFVDWISGCALLIRSDVVKEIGVLDERYFYYWEETEWCLRARAGGWKIAIVPQAKITHKGVKQEYRPGANVTYYWTRNWLLTLAKHHAPLKAWFYSFVWILRNLATWSIKPGWQAEAGHRWALVQGVRDFLRRQWGERPA